jgi:parvulin-like peptidyl-prolyl isomerase
MRKVGWVGMRNTILALLLGGLVAFNGLAQQTAPADKAAAPAAVPAADKESGKVILKAGTDSVTEADFDFVVSNLSPQIQQSLAAQGRRPLGEEYAMMLLLSQQAAAHKLDSTGDFRRRMAWQRIQWLAEAEVENIQSQVTVSPEEISTYYAANPEKFEEAQIRQVVVRKKRDGAPQDTPGLPAQEAKARADAIRAALAGGKDFKAVAGEFEKPNEILVGTDPRSIRRGLLPAQLDTVVFQLKDGELSQPLENEQAFILIQKLGSRKLELKDVEKEVEDLLRRQKVQSSLADLRKQGSVWMDEEFFAPPAPASSGAAPQGAASKSNQ